MRVIPGLFALFALFVLEGFRYAPVRVPELTLALFDSF